VRVIIAGTRTIADYDLVARAVAESGFAVTLVISGMARGVDTLALRYAREHGIPVEEHPANWSRWGKSAGYRRNLEMAKVAEALIAITTGSPGTAHMIEIAESLGLQTFVKRV
jgi:hypothetical protein